MSGTCALVAQRSSFRPQSERYPGPQDRSTCSSFTNTYRHASHSHRVLSHGGTAVFEDALCSSSLPSPFSIFFLSFVLLSLLVLVFSVWNGVISDPKVTPKNNCQKAAENAHRPVQRTSLSALNSHSGSAIGGSYWDVGSGEAQPYPEVC